MLSRPVVLVLLALGCVTAAGGGAYLATRHNASDAAAFAAPPAAAPAASTAAAPSAQPVAETEAAVSSPKTEPAPAAAAAPAPAPAPAPAKKEPASPAPAKRQETRTARTAPPVPSASTPKVAERTSPARTLPPAATAAEAQPIAPVPAPSAAPEAPKPAASPEAQPEPPRAPQFEEVILPASSVIGLQLESSLSSERARVEDRVDARVTRDVLAGGRVAIPAGARVLGSVTLVERGGKMKDRARLGIRFHTLVLADGSEVPLHTEAVYRDGESPAGSSAKKIGAATAGGAILGAILGGGKGAAIGSAAGAAGGTAVVMNGDRNAATLSRGEIMTAKLSAPATLTVERRE